jgi:hypothetical protein
MGRPPTRRPDHRGKPLPAGVYLQRRDGEPRAYKIRWREATADGDESQYSMSFSAKKCGSLDAALRRAKKRRKRAVAIAERAESEEEVELSPDEDPASRMTLTELFADWRRWRGPAVSPLHRKRMSRYWREISSRQLGEIKLERLNKDPALLVRFQDQLAAEQISAANRAEILKALRAVLRWGRKRHPTALNIELSHLFTIPRRQRRKLTFVTDAYGLERIIEAVRAKPVRSDIYRWRDVAFVAAMCFTVASRPSEWLYSARWRDLHEASVDLQQSDAAPEGPIIGLKSGARAALLLGGARERIAEYRAVLEERFGPLDPKGLVFQALDEEGPMWIETDEGRDPLAWPRDAYLNWAARVWRPARERAALAPDVDERMAEMRFYDCRHTAISMALHSNLVINDYGMNLHSLAAWCGHDVQTLQGYYAHVVARYLGTPAIDLEEEGAKARSRVRAEPSEHLDDWRERSEARRVPAEPPAQLF